MRIAVVTGNPKPGSRTQSVALAVADALAAELGASSPAASTPSPPPASPESASAPPASPESAHAPASEPSAPDARATPSVPYVPIVPAVVGVPAAPTVVSVPGDPGPAAPVPVGSGPAASGSGSFASPQASAHLVVDLAEHASSLFEPSAAELSRLSAEVAAADIAIFASPTYKAAYTGMLKAFLDRYGSNALAGTVAVAVMTGGWPGHLLAVEVHLRPVLVELGATVPARGLYVTEPEFATLDTAIATWAKAAVPLIRRALTPG